MSLKITTALSTRVLDRMHRGLLDGDAGLAPSEARWVARRLAELLGWDWQPE